MTSKKFNQCLKRIRDGDKNGIVDIYNEYYQNMILTALAKVNNIKDAEDIASDFIKHLLMNAAKIDFVESPDAWVFQSIRYNSINYIRKSNRSVYIDDCTESVFSTNYNYELHTAFIEGMEKLTEYEQNLVLLHYIYGFNYHEISKMVDRKVNTIKSDIRIIKEKLHYLKKFR